MIKKYIIFGAGYFGKKALDYLGQDNVEFFVDNNNDKVNLELDGKLIISFTEFIKIQENYSIVIAVDARKAAILAKQLDENGIENYELYIEMVKCYKNHSHDRKIRNCLSVFKKAENWIEQNSVLYEGIINNTDLRKSYPEVTGYYIPTLMHWGYRDLAINYAKWLCSIQKEDGSWYDTEDKNPYVFDTAQIIKGLLVIYDIIPQVQMNIIKGCEWILSNIQENGRLITPSKEEWGEDGTCSELIHLYCLSPLIDASKKFGIERFNEAAIKVAEYYIREHIDEILHFNILSHFYAYIIEALCDIGREDIAKEAMNKVADIQREDGMIPAYKNVNWVCSTGLFQFAIIWYKLGDINHGNKAFNYAMQLQNESGGWYGSYATVENPKITNQVDYPNYFQSSEISWAVKYFLDALYFKCKLEFEIQAPVFLSEIERTDGRYQTILNELKCSHAKRVCDVGCGKGRYIKKILEDIPEIDIFAVDLSENVMKNMKSTVNKKQGSLTQIPFDDDFFDVVFTVEALEHAIAISNGINEMLRITKKGGKIIIIDKNKSSMGLLEIDEWEQWFEDEFFIEYAKVKNCGIKIKSNIMYEVERQDGLFNAWILEKK